MPILRILCYNGSLVTWTVISLATVKFKPLTFSTSGVTLSYSKLLQSQSYFTTGSSPPIISSWRQAPWDSRQVNFIFQLNICGYSPYVTSSLTRGWVCRLQLLLVLASAVILMSESRRTHDDILPSQIRDCHNLEDQIPIFISPRNRVDRLHPQSLGSRFVASCDS
jgi:hypothetical protein